VSGEVVVICRKRLTWLFAFTPTALITYLLIHAKFVVHKTQQRQSARTPTQAQNVHVFG